MADKHPAPVDSGQTSVNDALPEGFEAALAQLEALVERMEGGELGLDESIAAYERGAALARVCQQRLDAAEHQVSVLQGNLLKPFVDAVGDDEP
ncbi:exodeoxyribonuclease VII small subunit [Alcaligenaceae bacterium CGII-47]|nr:exodeoxyribonuclease VII small subunit [Alcaligenaceae bacterium CGII-47]